jgi:cation-transporting ATPase 13A2
VKRRQYGQSLSTIFGLRSPRSSTFGYDDDDPTVSHIRYIDYRYIRFIYHPLSKKFMLNNHWKDPEWTSMRALRTGIDGDSKAHRNLVFGENVIDIDEKTIPQLLVDEVGLIKVPLRQS